MSAQGKAERRPGIGYAPIVSLSPRPQGAGRGKAEKNIEVLFLYILHPCRDARDCRYVAYVHNKSLNLGKSKVYWRRTGNGRRNTRGKLDFR